jgi:AcrR family transcriptional regulator
MVTAAVVSLPDATARLRLIESAMLLFSKSGVEDVSIRDLTAHAGVNLAAVNYHFRSKEALAQTVFEELSKRVNRRRVQELKAILDTAEEERRRPRLEDIISCFIRPYLDEDESNGGLLLARLILQHRLSPTEMTKDLMKKHFDPMAKKFIAALALSCPEVPSAEFFWRYTFMVSTVVLTMTDRSKESRLVRLSAGKADPSNSGSLHAALLRFLAGGMRT